MRHLFGLLLVLISIDVVAPLTLNQLMKLAGLTVSKQPNNHILPVNTIAVPPTTTPEVPSTSISTVPSTTKNNVEATTFEVADNLIQTGEKLMETIKNETKAIQAQALAAAQEADRIERVYEFIGGYREKFMGIVGDRLVVLERKMFQAGDKLEDMTIKITDFFNALKGINNRYKAAIKSANAA